MEVTASPSEAVSERESVQQGSALCDWATWQLLDSLLPTGSFAHSGGLEAAVQRGMIADVGALEDFALAAMENACSLLLPFAVEAHLAASQVHAPAGLPTEEVLAAATRQLMQLDGALNAMMTNHVARRASLAQGAALLRVCSAAFPTFGLLRDLQAALRAKAPSSSGQDVELRVRRIDASEDPKGPPMRVHGHHAVVFGVVCSLVGMEAATTQRAFLYITLPDILSAATRLNVTGPLESAATLQRLAARGEAVLRHSKGRGIHAATQTAPLLDLVQAGHSLLFSKLFLT